ASLLFWTCLPVDLSQLISTRYDPGVNVVGNSIEYFPSLIGPPTFPPPPALVGTNAIVPPSTGWPSRVTVPSTRPPPPQPARNATASANSTNPNRGVAGRDMTGSTLGSQGEGHRKGAGGRGRPPAARVRGC